MLEHAGKALATATATATADTCWAAEVKIVEKHLNCFALLPTKLKFINFILHFIKQNFSLCLLSKEMLDDFNSIYLIHILNRYIYIFLIFWPQWRNKLQNLTDVGGFAPLQMHFAHAHTQYEQLSLFTFCDCISFAHKSQKWKM